MPAAKEQTAEKNKSLTQLKQGPISGIIMLYYKLMHFPSVLRLHVQIAVVQMWQESTNHTPRMCDGNRSAPASFSCTLIHLSHHLKQQ